MARAKQRSGPAVLTANALLSGDVVFWSGLDWVRTFAEAAPATGPEEREALAAIGREEEAGNRVVGAYLVDLDPLTGEPAHLRERRRIGGPSIALPASAARAA